MSAPVFGRHSAYRNDIHVVSRFSVRLPSFSLGSLSAFFAGQKGIVDVARFKFDNDASLQVSGLHALWQRFCNKSLRYILFVGWFNWPVPSTDAFQQG